MSELQLEMQLSRKNHLALEAMQTYSQQEPMPRQLFITTMQIMAERDEGYSDFYGALGSKEIEYSIAYLACNGFIDLGHQVYWPTQLGEKTLAAH